MDNVKLELGGVDDGEGDGVSSFPQLPEDIIFDVLARLPVKTLCRHRCVCKAWRALISSPAFACAQASRAAAPLVAGVFGTGTPRPFHPARRAPPRFRREPSPLELRVLDPADGGSVLRVVKDVGSTSKLMCLGRLAMVDQGHRGASVIDPATGRAMVLDGSTTATTTVLCSDGTTAAAEVNTVHACMLCYNSLGRATPSGAYKVVRLRDGLAKNVGAVQICHVATVPWPWDDATTATSCCWRQRPEPPVLTCCCSDCTAVVDGVLHFMNHRSPSHNGRPFEPPPMTTRSHVCIASFDLESEEWKPTTISGPPAVNKGVRWEMALAALRGSLCLIQTDDVRNSNLGRRYYTKNIWFLVDSERSIWVKEYAIRMPESWCLFTPLEILVDGRILMLNAFKKKEQNLRHVQGVLQLYHPGTGALTDLVEMGNDFRGPLTLYTGSLFSG